MSPSRRKGSSNPDGYDDPDWYEKPGETVLMDYRPQPGFHTVPPLPWQSNGMGESTALKRAARHSRLTEWENTPCSVCTKPTINPSGLCSYCARSQQRYERNAARNGSAA